MQPYWVSKIDPEHYPVRFLASLWQQRMASNFRVAAIPLSRKQYGQLRDLMKFLGDLTQHVIEWMFEPANWLRFSLQVRMERKLFRVPDYPEIWFLLQHRNVALKFMRWELRESTNERDVIFCRTLDHIRYEQMKTSVLVLSHGKLELFGKISAAKTLTDIQRVCIEIIDENPDSTAAQGS